MKKTLKVAVAMSMLAAPAMAATSVDVVGVPGKHYNMENPLFIPNAGQIYSKTTAGLMYKEADHSLSMEAKNHAGATEWPIYRLYENIGYGINDSLTLRAALAYTHDGDIDRKGMTDGRLGLNYRVFNGATTDGWVWDMYADMFLGGVTPMKATLKTSPNNLNGTYPLSFDYANYSNGRYGAWLGTQVGKTWGNFTGSVFAEIERTIGNDNTEITVGDSAKSYVNTTVIQGIALNTCTAMGMGPGTPAFGPCMASAMANPAVTGAAAAYTAGLPATFSVETKSTWEYSAGIKGFWELNLDWALGSSFTYKHHSANTVTAVNLNNTATALTDAQKAEITAGIANAFMGSLQDGWDEYIFNAAISRKLTNNVQVALYGEYTMDDSEIKSQNGTDVKVEGGVRVNVLF